MATFAEEIDRAFELSDAAVKATIIADFKAFQTTIQAHLTTQSLSDNVKNQFDSGLVDLARWTGRETI